MVSEDELMEELGNLLDWLLETSEEVKANEVAQVIVKTVETYFKLLKAENPKLISVCEHAEMTITVSLIFGLCGLTSKKEETFEFGERMSKKDGKPN